MQKAKKCLRRLAGSKIKTLSEKNQSILLLGPRQTGKTTLVEELLETRKDKMNYYLQDPTIKLDLESDPGRLIRQVEAVKGRSLVFIDEAQKIPEIFDAVQYLIDKKKASFILTGSSARKLKRKGANLLPGRVRKLHLDPLVWPELGWIKQASIEKIALANINQSGQYNFIDSLIFGSLPAITQAEPEDRADLLRSYTEIYLEEEIRAEALSRKIGAFSRFLELAAVESGTSPNLTKLSNESGVSSPAIKEFYNILEDTLVVEKIEPYLKNSRKRILSSPRYYFFDLGVRNALARLPLAVELLNAQKGLLFEHAVILEIIRRVRVLNKDYKINYWRTSGGAEVDCVIDLGDELIPIEIKYSKNFSARELKGLRSFIDEHKKQIKQAYVVVMEGRREKIDEKIMLIPWPEL
jgi:uncharacterized protein